MRAAREPGQPPDHDCSAQELLGRVSWDGGELEEGKVKRWWTGSKPSSETPTVEPARVSDAHPLLSLPHHDFRRFLSERQPRRTIRATNLGLRSNVRHLVVPSVVCSRIPRCFRLCNMPPPDNRKRKADSDATPSATSAKAQKSVYYATTCPECLVLSWLVIPQRFTRSSQNQTRPVPKPARLTDHTSSG